MFHAKWPEAVSALLTGRYPMEKHDALLSGEIRGIKNVVAIGEG